MNEVQIVKELLSVKGVSYKDLAEHMGYKNPSGVGNRLQSKTMTVEVLVEILKAIDCELVIRSRTGDMETYVVTNENRNDVKVYKKIAK